MMNETEFEKLLKQNQSWLEKFCFKKTNGRDDRKDLVQEIWMKAWKSRGTFRGDAKFSTWLFHIARTVATSKFQKGKNSPLIYPAKLPDAEFFKDENDETLRELELAVLGLNETDKELIDLYLEKRTYKEIAQIKNTSEQYVGCMLMRVKDKLRKLLNVKR